jgi:hypothetical protein
MNVALEPRDCPYVGLDPFKSEYAPFFFGRERDSRVIADSVASRRITILYGASGVGKSSVLNVGLPAELRARQADWIIETHRDWHDPNGIEVRIRRALRDALPDDTALKPTKSPLLLVLDQFEEYFLYETRTEVTAAEIAFGELLSRRDLDLHVLIAVRDDSLHLLNKLRAVVPFVLETTIQLRHLSDDGARSAIRGPIKRYNDEFREGNEIQLEDHLVDAVIAQLRQGASRTAGQAVVSGSPEIELPYLQLTMTKLWDKAGGRNAIALRLQTLEDLGGVQAIARNHVDQILSALTPKEQALCADIFRYLVTGSGSKIAYPTDALAKQVTSDRRQESSDGAAATVSTEEVAAVLEELTRGGRRLLRPVKAGAVYELFHDVLGLPILEWRQKFLDNAAREETERERRAKEIAEQEAKKAIGRATAAANARAKAEEEKRLAESLAREAAEKAASEAKARATAETERAAAERQAREAAESAADQQKARTEAEQAARRQAQASAKWLRAALIAVAGAGLAALLGFGVSLYYSKEASQQSGRATAETLRAEQLAQRVARELDRANRAIAQAIDSDLVFEPDEPLAPRTRNALWKLARANDAVQRNYAAILANRPRELARAALGFPQISRSLGALWPQPDEAERLIATAIDALTLEDVDTDSLIGVIRALAPKLTNAQAGRAFEDTTKQISKTADPNALQGLAEAIQALPVEFTDAQASQALDSILKQFAETGDYRMTQALHALWAKLSEAQASRALDAVIKQIGQTTNPTALQALAQALQALPGNLTEAQASQTLDAVIKQIGQRTDPVALRTQALALQALPGNLAEAQASQTLDSVLKQIGQTTNPNELRALARAIQALAPKLTDAQASQALDHILKKDVGNTILSSQVQLLGAIRALAPKLTDAQAGQALDHILKQVGNTTFPPGLQAAARVIQALAPRLTDAQAQKALDVLVKEVGQTKLNEPQQLAKGEPAFRAIPQTTNPSAVQLLAPAIQGLASKLSEGSAQAALDLIVKQIAETTSPDALLQALAKALRALAPKLTETQARQVLDPILKQIGEGPSDDALVGLAQALTALAPKLSDAQAGQALDPIVKQIGEGPSDDALVGLAQALAALAPRLSNAQAGQALDPIVKQIADTTSSDALQALAQALTALAPKLAEAKARELSDLAGTSLAWAASEEEAADWARAFVALLDRGGGAEKTQKLVASVAYPAAAGAATDILLDAIRTRVTAAPASGAGTTAALQWLAAQYPEVLRPPVCPKPPQDFVQSGLQCPSDDTSDLAGVAPPARKIETQP